MANQITNRELLGLLNALSDEELDKAVSFYSGSKETLCGFRAEILSPDALDNFKHECYQEKNDGVSKLILFGEY